MGIMDKFFGGRNREQEAIDEYNLGFHAKYRGDWRESLAHNRRAAELNPTDEASWWNMGIAATALHDWPEARKAWKACGINMHDGDGEVHWDEPSGCVRINPDGSAETVWGARLDPARICIRNIPFPESDRRYGDIILTDGAQEGTRISNGREYPVFNELAIWKHSPYSTFSVAISGATESARESLDRLCEANDIAFEDWGTVRNLCKACSLGNAGEHACSNTETNEGTSHFGFASKSLFGLQTTLREWCEIEPDVVVGEISLALAGVQV